MDLDHFHIYSMYFFHLGTILGAIVTIPIEPCLVKLPTIICFTQQLTVQRHMTYLYLTVLILIQRGADNTKI